MDRPLQFHKGRQFFIGADDEMLFVAVSVHYPNRSPIKIQS